MRCARILSFAALALTGCFNGGGPLPDGGAGGSGGSGGACGSAAEVCADRGKSCGTASLVDRCGRSVSVGCGDCTSPLSCGGGGTPNVCGASCPGGCPTGFTCSPAGVCAGGSAASLALDVKTVAVSGKVTLNGATPQVGAGCTSPSSDMVTLGFIDAATGTSVTQYIPCSATDFSFSAQLAPGTYRVSVSPYVLDRSNLPRGSFTVLDALAVTGPASNLTLDVKAVTVTGVVTLNGQTPRVGAGCTSPSSDMVTLSFLEPTNQTSVTHYIPCNATSFAFTAQLAPGIYRVSVSPYVLDRSDLPRGSFGVNPAFQVSGPVNGATFDVKAVTVSGTVTLNGQTPQVGAGCTSPTSDMATLTFFDEATLTSVTHYIPCGAAGYAFSTQLAPGTYKVSVSPYVQDRTNLPRGTFVVNPALAVSGATSGVALDVKTLAVGGVVTLNGATPQVGAGCTSPTSDMVTLSFTEQGGSRVTAYIPCSAASFAFTTQLAPGTWKALVAPYVLDRSSLPRGTFAVAEGLALSAPTSGLSLDLKTVVASGRVTLNGATPQVGAGCTSPSSDMVTLHFDDASAPPVFTFLQALRAEPKTSITTYVPCSATDFSFSAPVRPGTYRVSVSPYVLDRSNLPRGTFVVSPRLELK